MARTTPLPVPYFTATPLSDEIGERDADNSNEGPGTPRRQGWFFGEHRGALHDQRGHHRWGLRAGRTSDVRPRARGADAPASPRGRIQLRAGGTYGSAPR